MRVVSKDYNSSFDELLEKDNSYKIHDRNLHKRVAEIVKVKMNLDPEIMRVVFEIVEGPHALRNELKLKSRKIHPVRHGIETASFVALESGTVYPVTLNNVNPSCFSSQR